MTHVPSTTWRMLAQRAKGAELPKGLDAYWDSAVGAAQKVRPRQQGFLRRAEQVVMEAGETGDVLRLEMADKSIVTYEPTGDHVMRSERSVGGDVRSWYWEIPDCKVGFEVERVGATGDVAWITLARKLPVHVGPQWRRNLAAAVKVGHGVD